MPKESFCIFASACRHGLRPEDTRELLSSVMAASHLILNFYGLQIGSGGYASSVNTRAAKIIFLQNQRYIHAAPGAGAELRCILQARRPRQ